MPQNNQATECVAEAMRVTVGAFQKIEELLVACDIESDQLWYKGAPLLSERLHEIIEAYFAAHGYHSPVQPDGMIIAGGVRTAEPHFAGEGILYAHEPIVVDLFPQHLESGYFADMTRTYVKGEPTKRLREMYEAVAEAQRAALAALRPGVACKDAYSISANVFLERGFAVGEIGYVHSLGHGVGQEIHQTPHLNDRSSEVLAVGDIITIEPGLYYPDVGGVRIEDTVVITTDGFLNLTNHPIDRWIVT